MSKKENTEEKHKQNHSQNIWVQWSINLALSLLGGIFFFYLLANIIKSQQTPNLYLDLVKEKDGAMVEFLKKARFTPQFEEIYPQVSDSFKNYENEIYADERKRRQLISELEQILAKNPKSRDVLYSLSLLYKKEGKDDLAQQYLERARELDPMVGR